MNNAEKLAQAREELADIVKRIEAFGDGDRPSSPPASLIHEEMRLKSIVDWYEQAERERIEREAKLGRATVTAVSAKVTLS